MSRFTFVRLYTCLRTVLASLVLLGVCGGGASTAEATPNFLRKLGNPADGCHACHTIMPRLNEFGYRFRAAGYRVPDRIGQADSRPFELGEYISIGMIARYDLSKTETSPVSSRKNQLAFSDIELFPFTGSLGANFSSKVELDFAPKGEVNFNTASLRYTRGDGDRFFGVRLGVLGAEGYGAADRAIGLSSAFFAGTPANYNQNQFFTMGLKSAAVELGLDIGRTALRAAMLNGAVLLKEDGALRVYGSQGGALAKPVGQVTSSSPDFQLSATRILTPNGGGVSVVYYHGHLGMPYLGTTDRFWKNDFERVAAYGSFPIGSRLILLGGYEVGRDHLETGDTFTSGGYFLSAEIPIAQDAAVGARYDLFDPARNKGGNEIKGITAFATLFLQNGLRVTAEFQHKDTFRGANPHRFDDAFQLRMALYR